MSSYIGIENNSNTQELILKKQKELGVPLTANSDGLKRALTLNEENIQKVLGFRLNDRDQISLVFKDGTYVPMEKIAGEFVPKNLPDVEIGESYQFSFLVGQERENNQDEEHNAALQLPTLASKNGISSGWFTIQIQANPYAIFGALGKLAEGPLEALGDAKKRRRDPFAAFGGEETGKPPAKISDAAAALVTQKAGKDSGNKNQDGTPMQDEKELAAKVNDVHAHLSRPQPPTPDSGPAQTPAPQTTVTVDETHNVVEIVSAEPSFTFVNRAASAEPTTAFDDNQQKFTVFSYNSSSGDHGEKPSPQAVHITLETGDAREKKGPDDKPDDKQTSLPTNPMATASRAKVDLNKIKDGALLPQKSAGAAIVHVAKGPLAAARYVLEAGLVPGTGESSGGDGVEAAKFLPKLNLGETKAEELRALQIEAPENFAADFAELQLLFNALGGKKYFNSMDWYNIVRPYRAERPIIRDLPWLFDDGFTIFPIEDFLEILNGCISQQADQRAFWKGARNRKAFFAKLHAFISAYSAPLLKFRKFAGSITKPEDHGPTLEQLLAY